MKYIIKRFDTLTQFSRYLNTEPINSVFKTDDDCTSKKTNRTAFCGTSSWEHAEELMRMGDKENLKRIKSQMKIQSLKGSGTATKREFYNSVVGFVPHVPNYVSGIPQNMIGIRRKTTVSPKIINIVYNPTVAAFVDKDDLIKASIEVMNYITGLESNGYKVNLYCIMAVKSNRDVISAIVRVKRSDEYTDLIKMVYPMVHPSFLRRHFFRFIEVADTKEKGFYGGYGYPLHEKSEMKEILNELPLKVDKYLTFYEVQRYGVK